MRKSFAEWMKALEVATEKKVGLSTRDLADVSFYDWYADGVPVAKALKMLLAENGFYG